MEQPPQEHRLYRFGVFEVDLATASVRRGGSPVRLRGKPFDVLVLLLERPGDVVTREELRARLWEADSVVDFEHGLNATLNRLRSALRDSAENPRVVQTLPRRGYRLIAPVEVVTRPSVSMHATLAPVAEGPSVSAVPRAPMALPASHAPRLSRRVAVALVVLGLTTVGVWWAGSRWIERGPGKAQGLVIAVLPLLQLNGANGLEHLSAGFADELVAQVGRLSPDTRAIVAGSAASSQRALGHGLEEIGQALGARYVLEGSVRHAGDRMRITVRLVDVTSEAQLWAESYERDASTETDGRAVAVRVASALVETLRRLSPGGPRS